MMSTDELRRLIKRPDLSDEQIKEIRATLYTLAEMLIDDYLREKDDQTGLTQ